MPRPCSSLLAGWKYLSVLPGHNRFPSNIVVWDLNRRRVVQHWPGLSDEFDDLAIAPDDRTIATADYGGRHSFLGY